MHWALRGDVEEPLALFLSEVTLEFELFIDEVMNRVFEGSGLELILKINHDHGTLVVVYGDELRHGVAQIKPGLY